MTTNNNNELSIHKLSSFLTTNGFKVIDLYSNDDNKCVFVEAEYQWAGEKRIIIHVPEKYPILCPVTSIKLNKNSTQDSNNNSSSNSTNFTPYITLNSNLSSESEQYEKDCNSSQLDRLKQSVESMIHYKISITNSTSLCILNQDNSKTEYWAKSSNRTNTQFIIVVELEYMFKNVFRIKSDINSLYIKLYDVLYKTSSYYKKNIELQINTIQNLNKKPMKINVLLETYKSMLKIHNKLKIEQEKLNKNPQADKNKLEKTLKLLTDSQKQLTYLSFELNNLSLKTDNIYHGSSSVLKKYIHEMSLN